MAKQKRAEITGNPSGAQKNKRPRASVEIEADVHAAYKDLVEGRKLVEVTTALIELFIQDPATQKKVARILGEKTMRRLKP